MKNRFKFVLFFVFLLILVLGGYFYFSYKNTLRITTQKGMVLYRIEKAITPEEQQKGLMDREYLPAQNGMLFIFTPPRHARMWMKNTWIALDMIFFDSAGKVVHVHENAHPLDTKNIIYSPQAVAGVLEINAGEAKKFGITVGSNLDLKNIR